MTYYKSSLLIGHNKARGIFLGLYSILFLFIFINSAEAFFHKKEKVETTNEITEDLYSKMNDKHVDAAAENLLVALETKADNEKHKCCLLYTSPSPRDRYGSRMPSSA